jgi:hypothetical protein
VSGFFVDFWHISRYVSIKSLLEEGPLLQTVTSRHFNQDTSAAKKRTANGPLIITDRGRPAHVLMTFAAYEKLNGKPMTLLEALGGGEGHDFVFEAPRLDDLGLRVPDFS